MATQRVFNEVENALKKCW